jgi:hypothetical protein
VQAATDYKKELGARSKPIDARIFKLKKFMEDEIHQALHLQLARQRR